MFYAVSAFKASTLLKHLLIYVVKLSA